MKSKTDLVSAIILLILIAMQPVWAQKSRTLEKSFSLDKNGRVSIDNYKGSITIETWNREQVNIRVKIEADRNDRYTDEKVKYTEIQISDTRKSLRIKTDYDAMRDKLSSFRRMFSGDVGNMPYVHYSIKMPATADLKIEDYKSECEIRDIHAYVEFETYKGSLHLRGLEGGIDLETYKGEIKVYFNEFSRRSSFETYKGEIDISLPARARFDLNANLGRRAELDSDFELKTSFRGRRRDDTSFRAEVNGGGTQLKIETEKGEIRLRRN